MHYKKAARAHGVIIRTDESTRCEELHLDLASQAWRLGESAGAGAVIPTEQSEHHQQQLTIQ